MSLLWLLLTLLTLYTIVLCGYFSVPRIAIVSASYFVLNNINPVCWKWECCTEDGIKRWVKNDVEELQTLLEGNLFGQHIATKILNQQLAAFLVDKDPEKPFVIHISGKTGTGKNHIANLIAKVRYTEGVVSKYILKIIATHHYTALTPEQAKVKLKKQVSEHVKKCAYSMIIVDEAEKLPHGTLNSISPFLDMNHEIDGIDYRKSLFVFLSNTAGNVIRDYTKQQLDEGRKREDITVLEMETLLEGHLYNSGELRHSSMISRYQLDAFIPMLPLERRHVKQCVVVQINKKSNKCGCDTDTCISQRANEISGEVDYSYQFSRSGCKKIVTKVNLICPPDRRGEL